MLVKYIDKRKELWEEFLDTCVFSYNTSKHTSSQYSPFELMFARKPTLPVEIDTIQMDAEVALEKFNNPEAQSTISITEAHKVHTKVLEAAKVNIMEAQRKQKLHYDKLHHKPGNLNSCILYRVSYTAHSRAQS